MEEPVLKTSKCLGCEVSKNYPAFKSGEELPGEAPRGRLYEALFANGDKAYIKGEIDRPPLYVGESGKEFFYAYRLVPKKSFLTVEVDRTFEPDVKIPLKRSKLADGGAAAAIAAQVPGVKLASELPAGVAPTEPPADPGEPAKVSGGEVPPSMRQPTKSFADTAKDTVKVTPEQLKAEAEKPTISMGPGPSVVVTQIIPDSQPRKGVIKSITPQPKDTFVIDGTSHYKYAVVMADGVAANLWTAEAAAPLKAGEEVNYTLSAFTSKGTPYKDGSKRMDIVAAGAVVGKDITITRLACVNSAIAFMALRPLDPKVKIEDALAFAIETAKKLEAHVLRAQD